MIYAQADVYLGHMRYPVLNVGSLNEAAMEVNGGDYLVATHGTVLGVAVSALASRLVCGQYCMNSRDDLWTDLSLQNVSLLKDLGYNILLLVSSELIIELRVRGGVQLALVAVPVGVSVLRPGRMIMCIRTCV